MARKDLPVEEEEEVEDIDDEEVEDIDDLPTPGLSDALYETTEKSELDKIFAQMLHPDNIHHNTELTQDEITGVSTLYTLYNNFKDKGYPLAALEKWLIENLKLRVSKNRQGRKEWVKITTKIQDEQKKTGFFDNFRRD